MSDEILELYRKLKLHGNEISAKDVMNHLNSSRERVKHLLEEDKPKRGIALYEYQKEMVRLSMISDKNSERSGEEQIDLDQVIMFLILDRLIEKSKTYKNTDHYVYGFISTVAQMTFCFKRTDNIPMGSLLALWLVPAKVRACHNEYMTEDRIEYVLNLAKENRIDVNHF